MNWLELLVIVLHETYFMENKYLRWRWFSDYMKKGKDKAKATFTKEIDSLEI